MATGPERKFWVWLDAAVGPLWDAQRHEDKYSVGIPDVSYGTHKVNGWIELKAYDKWPTSGLPHFTTKQANWLVNRGETGGHCFILVRIKKIILLFDWKVAYPLINHSCNRAIMELLAIKIWKNKFNPEEFINLITE